MTVTTQLAHQAFKLSCFALMLATPVAHATKPLAQSVAIVEPKDGAQVTSPFKVKMAVSGLAVRKAGEDPNDKKSGHFHILIDSPALAEGQVIPADDKHVHFGKGQTETDLSLTPGPHEITVQFADGAHRAYNATLATTIHVVVKPTTSK